MEEWRDIKGYEGLYQVSNEGRVKNSKNGKILKLHRNQRGYFQAGLTKNGVYKMYVVHRLVAQAFLPNTNSLPFINHKDEDKGNNFVFVNDDGSIDLEKSNLEWCTHQYNMMYGTRNKRISEKLKGRKLSEEQIKKLKGHFVSDDTRAKISKALKGKRTSLGMTGHHRSVEDKKKLSEILKGRKLSEETKRKMSESRKKPIILYTKNFIELNRFNSIQDAAAKLGLSKSAEASITKCCKGRLLTYKGFIFRYA